MIITRNVFYMSDEMFFTAAGPNSIIALLTDYTKTDRPRYLNFVRDIIWVGIEKTLLVWKLFRSGVPITIAGDKIFWFFFWFFFVLRAIHDMLHKIFVSEHIDRVLQYVCSEHDPQKHKLGMCARSGGLILEKMCSAFTKSAVKYDRH